MYTRKKKYNKDLEDKRLIEICEILTKYNKDVCFAFKKSYTLKDDVLNEVVDNVPIIMVDKSVDEILVPSPYTKVNGDSISYWYDLKTHLAKFVYVPMVFRAGKAHERQYLYTDKDEINKLLESEEKEYKRTKYK